MALALVCYGHTLLLPLSLIDDGLFYERTQQMFAALSAGELEGFWGLFWTPQDNRFGPGLFVQLLLYHGLGGTDPAFLHVIKVCFFALVIGAIVEMVRLSGRGLWGAVSASLVFAFLGRPTLFPDIQTHFANWQRLHTTDSHFVWLVVWMAVALLHFVASRGRAQWVWGTLAVVCIGWAALAKVSAIAHLGGAVVALGCVTWRGRDAGRLPKGPLVLTGVLVFVALPGLAYFRPWATSEIMHYEGMLSSDWDHLRQSLKFASLMFLESWGPLVFLAIPWAVWRFAMAMLGRTAPRDFHFVAIVLGIGSAAFCLQMLWGIHVPRYHVIYTPFLAVLCGVFLEDSWRGIAPRLAVAWQRPHRALLIASVSGCLLIALACVPVVVWQRVTLLRHVPMLALLGTGAMALVFWWLKREDRSPRSVVALTAVAGLFFGAILLHAVCLVAYAHQSTQNYIANEQSTTELLEAARRLHQQTDPERSPGRAALHANHYTEPWLQAAAFIRAGRMDERIVLNPHQVRPDMVARDVFFIFSHENHFDARVVPPVVGGWESLPIGDEEEREATVVLHRGDVWARTIRVEPGTTITGIEFRADTRSWPARSEMEISFLDRSGPRAVIHARGDVLPRMGTNTTFHSVEVPFTVDGGEVRIEARLQPGSAGPTRLARYLLPRSRVVAPAVLDEEGSAVMMARLYGTADPAPRYQLESARIFERSSYVVLPPGALLEQMLFGGVGPRSPHNQAFRPVTFRYRTETWRLPTQP
ncbi:MAG: hypothetical protein KF858_03715 [Candidatus Sumerlaeia bacterium]|nr:hypothetical protein [Candidatus Sumerlaeia bacterium]